MRGAPHNGFAWLMFRIKFRISVATFGRPGCRLISASSTTRTLYGANDNRIRANDVQTTAPTGPPSREQDPQEPVTALEAQAPRRVLLENRELVAKRENLRL